MTMIMTFMFYSSWRGFYYDVHLALTFPTFQRHPCFPIFLLLYLVKNKNSCNEKYISCTAPDISTKCSWKLRKLRCNVIFYYFYWSRQRFCNASKNIWVSFLRDMWRSFGFLVALLSRIIPPCETIFTSLGVKIRQRRQCERRQKKNRSSDTYLM